MNYEEWRRETLVAFEEHLFTLGYTPTAVDVWTEEVGNFMDAAYNYGAENGRTGDTTSPVANTG